MVATDATATRARNSANIDGWCVFAKSRWNCGLVRREGQGLEMCLGKSRCDCGWLKGSASLGGCGLVVSRNWRKRLEVRTRCLMPYLWKTERVLYKSQTCRMESLAPRRVAFQVCHLNILVSPTTQSRRCEDSQEAIINSMQFRLREPRFFQIELVLNSLSIS